MARVTPIHTPADYPGTPDDATRQDLAELFGQLFPGAESPRIDESHIGLAVAAHNPRLALHLATLSRFMALDMPWSRRTDLRELAIQAVNARLRCEASFAARVAIAESVGISAEMLAQLAESGSSALFDEEQRLVVEYARAVAVADVPASLFERVRSTYGERGAVELTAVAGFWAFWAMLLNATCPAADAMIAGA